MGKRIMKFSRLYFTVIIPWKSGNPIREQHLHNLLACLSPQDGTHVNDNVSCELIIVEQVNEENKGTAEQKIKEIVPQEIFTSKTCEISSYKYIQCIRDKAASFNKSWLMNVGARQANHETLVFMDADSLFGADYFRQIKTFFLTDPQKKLVVLWNYLILLPGKDNVISRHIRPDMIRTLGGIWGTNKTWYFDEFGGMNENFDGYGGEDNEGYERGCKLLNTPHLLYLPYPLVHQYHDWETPSNHSIKLFELGRDKSQDITNKLISAQLGKQKSPTFINIEDL